MSEVKKSIRMLLLDAGPEGVFPPGTERHGIPAEVAQELIDARAAVEIPARELAIAARERETAMQQTPSAEATARRTRRKIAAAEDSQAKGKK